MKTSIFRNLLVAGALFASANQASALTMNASDTFSADNSIARVEFYIDQTSEVTIQTTGYTAGGFDPFLSLFGPSSASGGSKLWYQVGGLPVSNNNGINSPEATLSSPVLEPTYGPGAMILGPGFYAAIVTQVGNLVGQEPVPPYVPTQSANYTNDFWGANSGSGSTCTQFCTPGGVQRTNFWSLNITANPLNPVPEPETLALMVIGLAGMFFSRRRTAF